MFFVVQLDQFQVFTCAGFFNLVPVGRIADVLVLLELVANHLQELVGVGTQVLHEAHQILDGLLHHHSALQVEQRRGFLGCFFLHMLFE